MEAVLLKPVVSEKETRSKKREVMPFALRFMEKVEPVGPMASGSTYLGPTPCPSGGNDMDYADDDQ